MVNVLTSNPPFHKTAQVLSKWLLFHLTLNTHLFCLLVLCAIITENQMIRLTWLLDITEAIYFTLPSDVFHMQLFYIKKILLKIWMGEEFIFMCLLLILNGMASDSILCIPARFSFPHCCKNTDAGCQVCAEFSKSGWIWS